MQARPVFEHSQNITYVTCMHKIKYVWNRGIRVCTLCICIIIANKFFSLNCVYQINWSYLFMEYYQKVYLMVFRAYIHNEMVMKIRKRSSLFSYIIILTSPHQKVDKSTLWREVTYIFDRCRGRGGIVFFICLFFKLTELCYVWRQMSGAICQSMVQSTISAHRRTSLSIFHIVRRFVGILTKTAILYNRNSDCKTHKGRVPWQGLLTKSVKGQEKTFSTWIVWFIRCLSMHCICT